MPQVHVLIKSVPKRGKKKFTVPADRIATLKYLNEHGCMNAQLFKYRDVLLSLENLEIFLAKEDFADRIEFLNEMHEKTPYSEWAPRNM